MAPLGQRMDKILREQEDGTIITNPKDRIRTFFRKMAYRVAAFADSIRRLVTGQPKERDRRS
jgi:hypothetical protein